MIDWLIDAFLTYFNYIVDFVKSVLLILVGYFLDAFVWLLEYVFWIFDSIILFLWSLLSPLILELVRSIGSYVPRDVLAAISDSYVLLQYINLWVPVDYSLSLFIAYYGIVVVVYVARVIISLFPVGRA